jgi:hypothetical protein
MRNGVDPGRRTETGCASCGQGGPQKTKAVCVHGGPLFSALEMKSRKGGAMTFQPD